MFRVEPGDPPIRIRNVDVVLHGGSWQILELESYALLVQCWQQHHANPFDGRN